MKLIVCFLFSINILIANQTNVVKTSELELFLFKVGFESLLKDVDITKDKSNLNESELKKLNSKIEIIMTELYKDKRVLTNDVKETKNINTNIVSTDDKKLVKDISELKEEVTFLKNQINKLILDKRTNKKTKKIVLNAKEYKIKANLVNIRSGAFPTARVVEKLSKDTLVNIEYCNKYGWCKFKDEKKFVSKFLLKK